MIPWRIKTTCEEFMAADFDDVTEILLGIMCDIINEVPEELLESIRKNKCNILDSCDMNGDMAQYNDVAQAACETFNLPFYH